MQMIVRKTKEKRREEIEKLFDIFLENMKEFATNAWYASILTPEYRENWINEVINDDNIIVFIYSVDSNIMAFICIKVSEKENFVKDFQIVGSYQHDGQTFKNMIVDAIKHLDLSKEFTGEIWMLNNHSRDVFKHLGAKFEDGKFRLSSLGLANWLN